jgi:hypothetical protein
MIAIQAISLIHTMLAKACLSVDHSEELVVPFGGEFFKNNLLQKPGDTN